MDFTPGQLKLLAYWGPIQSAVSQRVSTADLWAAVRAEAAARGQTLTGVSAVDMNVLRSIASEQRNVASSLAAARPDQGITANMIARDVSSRPLSAQNAAPAWLVRFEHQVLIGGQEVTQWRTSTFEGFLPGTKAGLTNIITADAVALADDYQVTHVGVGSMFITAV